MVAMKSEKKKPLGGPVELVALFIVIVWKH